MYEEFISRNMSEEDHKYMRVKMVELSDLVNDILSDEYSSDAKFYYEISEGELEVTLVLDEEHKKESDFGSFKVLEILFDSDTMMVGIYMGKEEDYRVESVEEALDIIEKKVYYLLGISESKKSNRKVPRKYLTKNKSAMKREIEEFSGKDKYKTKWDADYKSGKGGKGKRYKTKKSASTKAYQKKYGKK